MIKCQRSVFILFVITSLFFSCQSEQKKKSQIVSDLEQFTKQINENPEDPLLYLQRANYYRTHKGYDEAILDYRKAIELDRLKPTYYFELADTHMEYLDVHNARVTMDHVVREFPNNIEARLKIARLLIILKEYDEAVTNLQRSKVMDPFNAEVEYTRGIYFLDLKKTEAAKKAFQAAVELDDQLVDGWIALGEIAAESNDAKTLTYFDNALLIEPNNIRALHAKAYLLQNSNRIDEALLLYEQINDIDSSYTLAYFNRGLLFMDRGELEKAEAEFKNGISIAPKMAISYYYLGIIREKQKRYEEAYSLYKNALAADPNFKQAADAIADFKETTD